MEEQKLTMAALAEMVGVHDSTILRLIRGEFDPRIELKLKIAGALRMRVDRLWQWPNIVPEDPAA